jgi:uncharacterized protein YceH (UPF0502 family)
MNTSNNEYQRPVWERHLQTLFGAVGLALLFWIFSEVQTSTVSNALLTQQVQVLTQQVQLLSGRIDKLAVGQYTIGDAAKDFAERDRSHDRIVARVTKLEEEMAEHDDRLDYLDPPKKR